MCRVWVAIAVVSCACGGGKPKPLPEPEPLLGHEQVKNRGLRDMHSHTDRDGALLDVGAGHETGQTFGTVAAGKRADLIVVDGDLLADITSVRKVVSTMRAGVLYEAAPLLAAQSVKP